MNPRARAIRFHAIKIIGCLACRKNPSLGFVPIAACAEIHHQNFGGKAGGKRLGDEKTLGLCEWHHRGQPPFPRMTKTQAAKLYGPALSEQSKLFRATYGDDAAMLKEQNDLIEQFEKEAA